MDWQPERLHQWLKNSVPLTAGLTVQPLPVGSSNEMYLIHCGSEQWILRKPPNHLAHQSAHNVLREYRIMHTLAAKGVRVPRMIAVCDDLTVIGAPFYIMDRVVGVSVNERMSEAYTMLNQSHYGFGQELIKALAELHQVKVAESGLDDIGGDEHFLDHQIERWYNQSMSSSHRRFDHIDSLVDWLRGHLPQSAARSFIHGDYRLENVIFSAQPPARAIAIIDWEMATIGDPLLDLGSLLAFWPERDNPIALSPMRRQRKLQLGELPAADELAKYYTDLMACSLDALQFYKVLAVFKRAVLLESRISSGEKAGRAEGLVDYVPAMLEHALVMAGIKRG